MSHVCLEGVVMAVSSDSTVLAFRRKRRDAQMHRQQKAKNTTYNIHRVHIRYSDASNRPTDTHQYFPHMLFICTFETIGINQQSKMSVYLSIFLVLL
jgi:hypothetical protein